MKINDLVLLKEKLKDFIFLLCDLDRAYEVSDVAEVLKIINDVIEDKEAQENDD